MSEIDKALEAADACANRPEDKKRLGPMFGRQLEILAAETRRLNADNARLKAEVEKFKESANAHRDAQIAAEKRVAEQLDLIQTLGAKMNATKGREEEAVEALAGAREALKRHHRGESFCSECVSVTPAPVQAEPKEETK